MVCMEAMRQMRVAWLEKGLQSLHWLARKRGRTGNLPAHLAIGIEGEDAVLFYLQRKGYTVVARRWSSGDVPGDVDLIAWNGPMLCFIEVKTRTREDFGRPFAAVDREKRKRISRGALAWLRMLENPDILFRFDVVEVIVAEDTQPRVELIKNAFPLSKPYLY